MSYAFSLWTFFEELIILLLVSEKIEKKTKREELHEFALKAPKSSGVYLWKDKKETVIYVGKAKSLKNRLSSYFSSQNDIKTRILISNADSIEYIQTENEYEALLLENNLIKKYKPKYNINLKDGKTYPVLKLTNEKYPRIYRTRNIKNDGAKYFGPFPNVSAVDSFLSLVKQNYKLRECKILRKRSSPCLYFHIGKCDAPCCKEIDDDKYNQDVDEIALLLDGDFEASLESLKVKMKEAASKQEFEKAARLRDGISAVYNLRGQNIVQDFDPESRDYIAWAFEGAMVSFAVLRMRNGKLIGRDLYRSQSLKDEKEILSEFLSAYYTEASEVPPRIFIPFSAGNELAEKWLSSELGAKTEITIIPLEENAENRESSGYESFDVTGVMAELENSEIIDNEMQSAEIAAEAKAKYSPEASASKSGLKISKKEYAHHKAALKMARFNAKEDALRRLKEQGDFVAVEDLQKRLNLPVLPQRIEGYDIAHLGGTYTVASLISFKDGNPDKKNYRIFKLKTTECHIDDYTSMKEVIARRYTRLLNEGADLPDLIMVDGGKGQVNAAYSVLSALDLDIPVVGLAKRNEEVFFPHRSEPVIMPRRSDALRLLQRVRDETHRFANTRNSKFRRKGKLKTEFENLPNIGKKRAHLLLEQFGTIEDLKKADKKIIASVAKISESQAEAILNALE